MVQDTITGPKYSNADSNSLKVSHLVSDFSNLLDKQDTTGNARHGGLG